MDIFEELHAEHEEVVELMASLEQKGRDEQTLETLRTEPTAPSKWGGAGVLQASRGGGAGAWRVLAEGEVESPLRKVDAARIKLEG